MEEETGKEVTQQDGGPQQVTYPARSYQVLLQGVVVTDMLTPTVGSVIVIPPHEMDRLIVEWKTLRTDQRKRQETELSVIRHINRRGRND